jgi:hypothetical protein
LSPRCRHVPSRFKLASQQNVLRQRMIPWLMLSVALARLFLPVANTVAFREPAQWTTYSSTSPPSASHAGKSATRSTGEN